MPCEFYHVLLCSRAEVQCWFASRWRPDSPFHASALCASVIDTVTLPYRLAQNPQPGPLGVPVGACHLRSLTELLARRLAP